MLTGQYDYNIDDKGRLNFPAKFREEMGATFTVTRWLDGCLVAFPEKEWGRMQALIEEKSLVKARNLKRILYASAVQVQPDKQGRILLPGHLRGHAKLDKDVTIIGVGSYAEIWDTAAWRKLEEDIDDDALAAAKEEMGL